MVLNDQNITVCIINEFALLRLCKPSHKRKNFLFLGSDNGGDRAATLYSLLGTAKLNGINPQTYLTHVLTVIADHKVNQISELLPWNVKLEKHAQVESENETETA
jgi:hypothetical protein